MELFLSSDDDDQIRTTSRELFLALVFASGQVKIKIAETTNYPGHAQWVTLDQIDVNDLTAGFSFIVKDRLVTGLFVSSEMNRTADWKLNDEQIQAVCRLLPMSPAFNLY